MYDAFFFHLNRLLNFKSRTFLSLWFLCVITQFRCCFFFPECLSCLSWTLANFLYPQHQLASSFVSLCEAMLPSAYLEPASCYPNIVAQCFLYWKRQWAANTCCHSGNFTGLIFPSVPRLSLSELHNQAYKGCTPTLISLTAFLWAVSNNMLFEMRKPNLQLVFQLYMNHDNIFLIVPNIWFTVDGRCKARAHHCVYTTLKLGLFYSIYD